MYPISVVIPTSAGWPAVRFALDPLLPQLRAHAGQLVVADVSGRPVPDEAAAPDTLWLAMPGDWIVRARREAYARAEGEIIAATEDHCTVAEDWIARMLAAHRDNPTAAAITGVVENGTTDHVADWALYLMAHVRLAPPLARAPETFGKTNVSYKRHVLQMMPRRGAASIEDLFNQQLRRAGHTVIADQYIRVAHHQCSGVRELLALQFHNGRMIAGIRRGQMTAADYLRAVAPPALAGYRLARVLLTATRKPLPRRMLLASLPVHAVMQLAHAIGETVGYVTGPGASPRHLH